MKKSMTLALLTCAAAFVMFASGSARAPHRTYGLSVTVSPSEGRYTCVTRITDLATKSVVSEPTITLSQDGSPSHMRSTGRDGSTIDIRVSVHETTITYAASISEHDVNALSYESTMSLQK